MEVMSSSPAPAYVGSPCGDCNPEVCEWPAKVGAKLDLVQADNYGTYFRCVKVATLLKDKRVQVRSIDAGSYTGRIWDSSGLTIRGPVVSVYQVDRLGERPVLSPVKQAGGLGRYWNVVPTSPAANRIHELSQKLELSLKADSAFAFLVPRYLDAVWQNQNEHADELLRIGVDGTTEERLGRIQQFVARRKELDALLETEKAYAIEAVERVHSSAYGLAPVP